MTKFIAKGSYGCVIKPAYDCNKILLTENTVSKLFMNKKDWNKEVKINKILEKLDPKNIFTVKMINNCPINIDKKTISKCAITKSNDHFYQIIYEYGGDEIINIFLKTEIINIIVILKQFIQIFEGLCILDENNIIHHDIKPNNILYDITKNKMYLIDFGLYITKDEDFIQNENKFIYHPSEYTFFNYYYTEADKINAEYYKHEMRMNIDLINKKKIDDNIKKKIIHVYDNLDKNKIAIYNKIKLHRDIDIHNKIDVYMFGLTLYEFLIATYIHCNEQNNISKIPLELFDLIEDMTNIDPYERITIQEATRRYKLLFHKM